MDTRTIGIIRVVKDANNPFAQIKKDLLRNKLLSWKAKGIASYILSLPDNWDLNIRELTTHATDGKESTAKGVSELMKSGYMTRERVHNKNGHFDGYNYVFYEEPCTVNRFPVDGKTVNRFPVDGKTVNRFPVDGKPTY
jgi:hypothetical protein